MTSCSLGLIELEHVLTSLLTDSYISFKARYSIQLINTFIMYSPSNSLLNIKYKQTFCL